MKIPFLSDKSVHYLFTFIWGLGLAWSLPACSPGEDRYSHKTVPELIQDLQQEDGATIGHAALALSSRGDAAKPAMPALINVLGDSRGYVRNQAIEALKKLGNTAVQPLIKALKHENQMVRFFSAHTLTKMSSQAGKEAAQNYMNAEGNTMKKNFS